MSTFAPTMSRPTTAQPSTESSIEIQVYYKGLATKHWVVVLPSSTFLELKEILSRPAFTSIPIANQKLIVCGVVPRDTDTMVAHGMPSGRYRVCLVRVSTPEELHASEEAAATTAKEEEEETDEEDTISETLSEEIRGILEEEENRLGWADEFTGEQRALGISDGEALRIAFFGAAR